ncbi:MAG: translation initiation factor eIF-1A [Thermoproteota archaeon]|nr:translation initiation factor eIF-1A [Candidatus Brockarchaeota archaeon]MBO3768412.1 translation initiation factor eIF-1A [Candidatus Brockarchaeota archaeon]MBO3801393.1 translation initiation factor eIF-1A [Candidatus Brockarchaeota archaeon]
MGKRKVFSEEEISKNLVLPNQGQVIGKVIGLLGSGWVVVACQDGKVRRTRVRGKLRRRIWVKLNDIVLVEPWPFQDDHGEILFRYTSGQVDYLISKNVIDEKFVSEQAS